MNRTDLNARNGFIDGTALVKQSPPNLFPAFAPIVFEKSPRLKWREAHDIHISYHPNKHFHLEWTGRMGLSQVQADTEDEAELAICEKHNLKHWSLL